MKKIFRSTFYVLSSICFLFSSCTNNTNNEQTEIKNKKAEVALLPAPKFNEDSAYSFVKKQVDFGPRIPGTTAHAKCGKYLIAKLKSYGLQVQVQNGNVSTYDGKRFDLQNIIASYKPEIHNRILLFSHWDSRPFADQDSVDPNKPFDSADDGPSGVGVILEIVRQLTLAQPKIGIDILFDDLEDYGKENDGGEDTWGLGAQYWAKNLPKTDDTVQYAILLDMVGAKGATFPREGVSNEVAPYVVKKIWNKAAHLGYSNYFVFEDAGSITDDHVYIIRGANIPCVDIVNMNWETGQFGFYHHRHSDNMNVIDKNTLKAVGQTILEVVWDEQEKSSS